ncbi:MAG: hypothetical protein II349_01835, partial [Akkermansia sp.]|nr:hypothetical protein [Akkermansia sp.]
MTHTAAQSGRGAGVVGWARGRAGTRAARLGPYTLWALAGKKDLLLPFKEQTKTVKEGEEILVALYIDKSNRLC